ncbi:MAG: hypothetical protein KJZ86_16110 [Caldilineaceae bacterium]|nr:hypothetical protein [Caldilineaceae bacterium]HRJ41192.1 hypothetical protein [Caldilineaceae bacterium]
METTKRSRLEAQGWQVGTVQDFLELTLEEATLVEIKLALQKNCAG